MHQSLPQLLPRLTTHPIHIHIRDYPIPPVNLLLCPLQIIPNPWCPPFIRISDKPTTLHQPLRALPTHGIKRRQHRFQIPRTLHPFVFQERGQDRAVFDAEPCSGSVVWGGCVRCVAGDSYAAFVEGWDGVVA